MRDVHVPVLWFLGDLDHNVPSVVNETKLKKAKKAAKNRDFTIRWVRNAGHAFLHTKTGDNKSARTSATVRRATGK